MQNLNGLYRCKRLNLIRECSTPHPSLIRTAVIIRMYFPTSKISSIRFGVHNIFSRRVSRGSEKAETCPLIKLLEVLFSPLYEGDNDRSYIPAAMKNGECRLVRLEAVSGGFARVRSNRLSSRGDIRDGSAESAGTGKRVIVCISTNGGARGGKRARDAL